MNVKEYNLIPSVKNAYTKLYGANYYRKIPILNIISKPSFYLYLLIIYFGITIYRKKNIDISILLLVYFKFLKKLIFFNSAQVYSELCC